MLCLWMLCTLFKVYRHILKKVVNIANVCSAITSPPNQVVSNVSTDAQDTGDDAFTDDHYTTTGPALIDTTSSGGKSGNGGKGSRSKSGSKHHLKPPRRAPQTFEEKVCVCD